MPLMILETPDYKSDPEVSNKEFCTVWVPPSLLGTFKIGHCNLPLLFAIVLDHFYVRDAQLTRCMKNIPQTLVKGHSLDDHLLENCSPHVGMVAHTCHSSTGEVETGKQEFKAKLNTQSVWWQPELGEISWSDRWQTDRKTNSALSLCHYIVFYLCPYILPDTSSIIWSQRDMDPGFVKWRNTLVFRWCAYGLL